MSPAGPSGTCSSPGGSSRHRRGPLAVPLRRSGCHRLPGCCLSAERLKAKEVGKSFPSLILCTA